MSVIYVSLWSLRHSVMAVQIYSIGLLDQRWHCDSRNMMGYIWKLSRDIGLTSLSNVTCHFGLSLQINRASLSMYTHNCEQHHASISYLTNGGPTDASPLWLNSQERLTITSLIYKDSRHKYIHIILFSFNVFKILHIETNCGQLADQSIVCS